MYLVLLNEVLYAGCQPAPVAIFQAKLIEALKKSNGAADYAFNPRTLLAFMESVLGEGA